MSFGSLLKARRILERTQAETDSSDSDAEESEGHSELSFEVPLKDAQPKEKAKKPAARAHKHALVSTCPSDEPPADV